MISNTFKTLLLREWMQAHLGWLILAGAPFVLLLLALLFGGVHLDANEGASSVMLGFTGAYLMGMAMLAWVSSSIQAPGLARRDEQDRSIEFWRSLPVGDGQAVAALLLVHLLLFPLLVVLSAMVTGVLASLLIVARVYGAAAWLSLPWGDLLLIWPAALLRMALGTLLAGFWLAPAQLLFMAGSAWLRRWGVPVVAGVMLVGASVLEKVYGRPELTLTFNAFRERFVDALIPAWPGEASFAAMPRAGAQLAELPGWLVHDALRCLGELASPWSLLALAINGACFWLLVAKRRRS